MKRLILGCVMGLAACDGAGVGGGSSGFTEYMVIGNRMTFEQCRARGGLIIRDANTSMVACDPTVRGDPVPADEFDHPGKPTG